MNIYALIPLVTSIFYIVLVILALPRSGQRAGRFFVYYLFVAACWSFSSFMLHLDSPQVNTLFWNEVLVIFLVWTLLAYYTFTLAYTNKRQTAIVVIGYLSLIVLAYLSFTGNIIQYSFVENGIVNHELGISQYFISGAGVALSALVVALLVGKYRRSKDPIDRNRTMYLFTGWSVVVLFTLSNLIHSLSHLPLDHVGGFLNALIITYAITRFHLLDIKLVFRLFTTYIATTLVIGVVAGGLIFAIFRAVRNLDQIYLIISAILIILAVSFIAGPISKQMSILVNKAFYPVTYKYRQILLGFGSKMGHILNMEDLAGEMLPALTKTLGVDWTALLLKNPTGKDYECFHSFSNPDAEIPQLSLATDSMILSWMEKTGKPLDPERIDEFPELRGLWQSELSMLLETNLGLLYPMKSRDRIVCILAIGKKYGTRIFSHEDLNIIANIADQAGVIVENAQLFAQANAKANLDELTGLYNHRHFHERLDQEIARGSRLGGSFSLIYLDLDLFKSYNDIYGHLAGDQVLRRVSQAINASIRDIDLAFRYGGDEFTVILPETKAAGARKAAERVRKAIASINESGDMPLTASIGVASWPENGVNREELIHHADTSMYTAKRAGGNRINPSMTSAEDSLAMDGMNLKGPKPKSLSFVYALAAIVDAKDKYTHGHTKKVSQYAVLLGEALHLEQEKINNLRTAGLMHDIGKVGISDDIINKKTTLTEAEWSTIRKHPELGVEILKHVADLEPCLPAIRYHHEKYDGTGYPVGLKGENIPIEARIMALADAFDAMTSPRPYGTQLTIAQGIAEIKRCAGTQFDPAVVETFCAAIESYGIEHKPLKI